MTTAYVSTKASTCQRSLGELLDYTPLPKELDEVFNVVPYQELLKAILLGRTRAFSPLGRPGYPLEAMLKAYLASYFIRGIGSIAEGQSNILYGSDGTDTSFPVKSKINQCKNRKP